jgi:F0F1-type ATP synthase delta subunit
MDTGMLIAALLTTQLLERLKQLLAELDVALSTKRKKLGLSVDLQAILTENGLDQLTAQTTAQLRSEVGRLVAELPVVKIVTAQPLEEAQQQAIQNWFSTQMTGRVILSFRTDSTIGAGVIIQTPKKHYDHSLQSGFFAGRARLMKRLAV